MESVFLLAVVVGFAAWFFGVIEAIGAWRFWEWVYRIGPVVFDECVPQSTIKAKGGTTVELPDLRARVLSSQRILFRMHRPFFSLRVNTPLPLKGVLVAGADARLVGRLPLAPLLFFAAWLAGWTAGGVASVFSQGWKPALWFTAFGWAAIAAMLWLSFVLERRRFRRAAAALLGHFGLRAEN